VVTVAEYTRLYFAGVRGDEPEFTAWIAEREFVFEKCAEGWILTSQRLLLDEDGIPPLNEPANASDRRALENVEL
jgi:hypothetical protein